MITDPIADYLTRIRNAVMANHRVVEIPASKMKLEMSRILFEKGYILKSCNALQLKMFMWYDVCLLACFSLILSQLSSHFLQFSSFIFLCLRHA